MSFVDSGKNQFAILGFPVEQSLSPLMHNTAFRLLDLPYSYEAIEVSPRSLLSYVRELADTGYRGFNVTIPHKESVLRYLSEVDEQAKRIGAANTVVIEEKKTKGYNTDITGILKSLEPFRESLLGSDVMVMGTGGAARTVVFALLRYVHPDLIRIVSRSNAKARQFVTSFAPMKGNTELRATVVTAPNIDRQVKKCSLIVNTTPVGMLPHSTNSPLPDSVHFSKEQIIFDLIYRPLETTLLKRASEDGATTISGLDTFLYQGAHAFELWTGKKMPIEKMRPVLEEKLA
jgi:shikimate dehydrogenase